MLQLTKAELDRSLNYKRFREDDHLRSGNFFDSDEDDLDRGSSSGSSHSNNSKRRRLTPSGDTDYFNVSTMGSTTGGSIPSTPTYIQPPIHAPLTLPRGRVTLEDWINLKEVFARAVEQYEEDETEGAIYTLRHVVSEGHRFLKQYVDPSVLFTGPSSPSEQYFHDDSPHLAPWSLHYESFPDSSDDKRELPTAFHAILGTALFLFGNIIATHGKVYALEGEPSIPRPYWLAALDIFETGEALPSRTNAECADTQEDWRMAIVWGRTLVSLSEDAITRPQSQWGSSTRKPQPAGGGGGQHTFVEEHKWPPGSPFATIATRRPPITHRMSLSNASPNELLSLAMDQFCRGILHMPHTSIDACSGTEQPDAQPLNSLIAFCRSKELYTIGYEVLNVAEKLPSLPERRVWAEWADSVFRQVNFQAEEQRGFNSAEWQGKLWFARGRCRTAVGGALAHRFEGALERGDLGEEMLEEEEAKQARDVLEQGMYYFQQAEGCMPGNLQIRPPHAKCILTLANLTVDEVRRKKLREQAASLSSPPSKYGQNHRRKTSNAMDESQ